MNPTRTIKVVFISLLLDILSFSIILPLFPRILEYYKINDASVQEEQGLFQSNGNISSFTKSRMDIVLFGGAIGSLYSLLQFAVAPYIGRLSDKIGRKNTLLLSLFGNILSCLIWVYAKDFSTFVLSRVVAGLSEGNVQLSVAMISDVTNKATRSKGLAVVGIAFALGFTFGPTLGALMSTSKLFVILPESVSDQWGLNPYSNPAFLSLMLVLVELVFVWFFLEETISSRQFSKGNQQNEIVDTAMKDSKPQEQNKKMEYQKKLKQLNWLSAIHFIYLFTFSGMEFTVTFLTFERFDFSNIQQGKMLGYIGIMSALIQGGYVRRKARTIGEKKMVEKGVMSCWLALYILSTLAIPGGPFFYSSYNGVDLGIFWLYVAATFLAVTSATVVNCLTALASLLCDDEETSIENGNDMKRQISQNLEDKYCLPKGKMLGKFRSFGQLGRAVGPMFACSLYWYLGSKLCYLLGSVLMVMIHILIKKAILQVCSHSDISRNKSS